MAEPRISFDEARAQSLSKWKEIQEKVLSNSGLLGYACGFCRRWTTISGVLECDGCEAYGICRVEDSLFDRVVEREAALRTAISDLVKAISALEPPEEEEG